MKQRLFLGASIAAILVIMLTLTSISISAQAATNTPTPSPTNTHTPEPTQTPSPTFFILPTQTQIYGGLFATATRYTVNINWTQVAKFQSRENVVNVANTAINMYHGLDATHVFSLVLWGVLVLVSINALVALFRASTISGGDD